MCHEDFKTRKIDVEPRTSFAATEELARRDVADGGPEPSLVGWWDTALEIGGPLEACGNEPRECIIRHVTDHGAAYKVIVGDFEFFYTEPEWDAEELERSSLLEVHRNLHLDAFENVQGG